MLRLQKISYRQTLRGVNAMLVAAVVAPTMLAQEDTQAQIQLDKVMVTATRIEQEIDKVTRSVAFVGQHTIESIQAQSVAQLLNYQANINIEGGPRADSQAVNIRGLTGNKILQTVDGVRQVFESGHRPSYFLDPELLQSVEAIKGPSSSLWGSGAIGGVVAQNTVDAADLLAPNQTIGGFAKTRYNSDQNASTAAVAIRTDTMDWLLSSYYRDQDDISLGNGDTLTGSASRKYGALVKSQWQIDDDQRVEFNYRIADTKGHVPSNGTAAQNNTSNFLLDRNTQSQNVSIDYQLDSQSPLLNAQLLAYWNQVDIAESRVSDERSDDTELDVYGFSVNNQSNIGDARLFYGIDGYREIFNAKRGGTNRPTPPKAETNVWGAYIQGEVPLSAAWLLEIGLRYDDFDTEAKNLGQSSDDTKVSPTLGLSWQTTDWMLVSLRHDRAYRAPSAEELYVTGAHFCLFPGFCNVFVANPELDAEEAANSELLVKLNFDKVLGADSITVQTSMFVNKVDNFIEQIVTPPSFFPVLDAGQTTFVNVDKAKLKGFEITARYQRQNFVMSVAYGQTRGKDEKTNADLTQIPADTFNADISYVFWRGQVTTGLRLTHTQSQNRTDFAENTIATIYSSYTITDLYASWQPEQFSALKLDLSVNNLSDKYYRKAWQELYEPGREVLLSAKYRF